MSDLKSRILLKVKDDLAAIEIALSQNLNPHLDLVNEVARHILFSGGKRLRPLLMVLASRICGYEGRYDTTFSIIFEYLHAATLLHDDLVDGATLRRGKPAAYRRWGNEVAVLVGDFLLARSLTIAAETRNPRIIKVVAQITENMSQGEIDQLQKKGNMQLSKADYMEVIKRKTAVLFQGACRAGALISNAPEPAYEALSGYGYHLGMAFQIADDLLDYTTDSQALGKKVGADLREGKITLPLIHALQVCGAEEKGAMAKIIGNPEFSDREFQALIGLLDRCGGIDYSRQQAIKHIDAAKAAILKTFGQSQSRDVLIDVADYALARKH